MLDGPTGTATSEAMKKTFPKPVAVVNRAGAAGTIGNAEVVLVSGPGIDEPYVEFYTLDPGGVRIPYRKMFLQIFSPTEWQLWRWK